MGDRVDKVISAVEAMLNKRVWKDTFLLRWAHNRIEGRLKDLKDSEKALISGENFKLERVSIFVEIYQKDLGIITLSRVISSLGDRAFGKNIYKTHSEGKKTAECAQRVQKNIAFIEVVVMPDKLAEKNGELHLLQGAIDIKNVKGVWFRDIYYLFDVNKRMFVRG